METVTHSPEKSFWLVERLAQVSSQLDESVDAEKVMKKVRFLCYELGTVVQPSQRPEEKLKSLKQFFFATKNFTLKRDEASVCEDDFLLHRVLQKRQGSFVAMGLLFQTLAEHVGLKVELVELEGRKLLKYVENGQSQFFDFMREGMALPKAEMLDLLNNAYANGRQRTTALLESLREDQIVGNYLLGLRKAYQAARRDQSLLKVLNMILSFQTSDFRLLAERAMLKTKMGILYEALQDCKRYFSFYGEQHSPPELVELYRKLKKQIREHAPL